MSRVNVSIGNKRREYKQRISSRRKFRIKKAFISCLSHYANLHSEEHMKKFFRNEKYFCSLRNLLFSHICRKISEFFWIVFKFFLSKTFHLSSWLNMKWNIRRIEENFNGIEFKFLILKNKYDFASYRWAAQPTRGIRFFLYMWHTQN